MSTPIHATDVAAFDHELNHMILKGQIRDAFEKFYAEDVVMQENLTTPKVGKAANRKAEQDFVGRSIEPYPRGRSAGQLGKWRPFLFKMGVRCHLPGRAPRQTDAGSSPPIEEWSNCSRALLLQQVIG